jgi:tRNA(Ile)-lysidine synthase
VALEDKIPWLAGAPRGGRWLVGVSGGADSVALLHLLVRNGFSDLVVCHLDHRLRGRESTADAGFVRRLAGKLGVACEIGCCDVRVRMSEHKESMETAARNARLEFFARCAAKSGCHRVLLAHHADDQAETVLWNLLRGSHGLRGMRQDQRIRVGDTELQLVRPLLDVRHAELVAWLEAQRLDWREDASNLEPVAVRNRLRNEVFPLLTEISGRDAVLPFVRGAADAAQREECEADALDQANLLDPQGRLHLGALRKLTPDLQRAGLRAFLVAAGIPAIDRALLQRAAGLLDPAGPASVNLSGGKRLRRRAGRIWIDCQAGGL